MAMHFGNPSFCPFCGHIVKYYTEFRGPVSYIQFDCGHDVLDVIGDEGGLFRFKFSFPNQIVEPKTIYEHGFNACLTGIQECENPYPGWWRSEKYNEWQKGWREARRLAQERQEHIARLSPHTTLTL